MTTGVEASTTRQHGAPVEAPGNSEKTTATIAGVVGGVGGSATLIAIGYFVWKKFFSAARFAFREASNAENVEMQPHQDQQHDDDDDDKEEDQHVVERKKKKKKKKTHKKTQHKRESDDDKRSDKEISDEEDDLADFQHLKNVMVGDRLGGGNFGTRNGNRF